ncbi:MAG TPA: VWA domain-containing protein [Polyangiaceae bacterium]|nr:VWA domain-containing protein [Polyangiaceae bacterium]
MGKLELLLPKGLWLLALLVPLIILYILKVKRKRLVVPSTWLWASAKRDLLAKAPFRKLLAQLSLILQALALILLALALARPSSKGAEVSGTRLAIVIDVSASMGTATGEEASPGKQKTRLDQAKASALDLVKGLAPGAEAMVVEAGRDARIATPLDRDTRRIAAAIEGMQPQDVEGDLGTAVALSVDRLKSFDAARVIVLTDGYLARPPALEGVSVPVEVLTIGDEVENAGIVRTDVRSGIDPKSKQEEVQAFLLLVSYGKTPREAYVTMRFDGSDDVLASRRMMLPPGEKVPVVLSFRPSEKDYGRGLVLDVSPHDAMAVDDVAYARVPSGDRLPVLLASPDKDKASGWLERALASDPGVSLSRIGSGDLAAKSASIDPGALIVLDGACPAEVPGGDVLVVHPPEGECFGVKIGGAVEKPSITSWETGDARMRFLTLDGVAIARANKLDLPSVTQSLVRSETGVLVADVSTASRTGTLVGFDVGESDWPLKASFVLFVRNVAELARAHRASGALGAITTGEPLRVNAPTSATGVTVTGPAGEPLDGSLKSGLVVVPKVTKVGLYHLVFDGPTPRDIVVPVNLTSSAESDLSKRTELPTSPTVTVRAPGELPEQYRDYAWIAALVALALFVVELFWFTRKPRTTTLGASTPRAPERRRASAGGQA